MVLIQWHGDFTIKHGQLAIRKGDIVVIHIPLSRRGHSKFLIWQYIQRNLYIYTHTYAVVYIPKEDATADVNQK